MNMVFRRRPPLRKAPLRGKKSHEVGERGGLIGLRVWRQFLAVAEELHFGRAALRLHMSQPPLTQAIALLEQRLKVKLFDRTKRSVALTPAGTALLPDVRDLLQRASALPNQARAAAAGEVARLCPALSRPWMLLPEWVRAVRTPSGRAIELVEATGDAAGAGAGHAMPVLCCIARLRRRPACRLLSSEPPWWPCRSAPTGMLDPIDGVRRLGRTGHLPRAASHRHRTTPFLRSTMALVCRWLPEAIQMQTM
jgi:hypothetical protein